MIVHVSYQVQYTAELEIDSLDDLDAAIDKIAVPENETSELDGDSFDVICVCDEHWNEIERD